MKRPRWTHEFTKGIQAIRKTLSLVTKGIQDQKIGGKPIPYTEGFEWDLWFVAAKRFDYKIFYSLLGKVRSKLNRIYAIKLGVTKDFRFDKQIITKVLSELNTSINLLAKKRFNYKKDYNLNVSKRLDYKNNYDLTAQKRFDLDNNLWMQCSKSFDINQDLLIKGKKRINFEITKDIKIKKDITPILVALDLME